MEAPRARLKATFSKYLPEFLEFQQFGHNMLFPKAADIDALQSQLRSMQTLRQPLQRWVEQLRQPAEAFLDKLRLFQKEKGLYAHSLEYVKFKLALHEEGGDEDAQEYYEAIKHANRMAGYLSGTLDLIQIANDNHENFSSWQDFLEESSRNLRDKLSPIDADSSMGSYAKAQTRGNLTKDNPENIKFSRIVNSATWDERQKREALSEKLTGQAKKLLSGIKLVDNYAKKTHEDNEVNRLAEYLRDVCKVLPRVVKDIKVVGKSIRPSAAMLPDAFKLPKQKKEVTEEIKDLSKKAIHPLITAAKAGKKKALGVKDIFAMLSDKAEKNKHRAAHALPYGNDYETNEATRKTNEAVFQAGMILSDKIQQTVSNIYKVQQAARPLQHAVELDSGLSNELSQVKANQILDAKLAAESARWKEKAEESRKQLQETLVNLTALAGDPGKNAFLSQLRTPLSEAPQDPQSASIISDFDAQIKAFVDTLAGIEKGLKQVAVRLSEHGVAGGKELDKKVVKWTRDLGHVKDELKTSITQATGRSINNFSRHGMLARRMGVLSESEKQLYLAELSPEDREQAETQYDILFFEVLKDYLPLLSKDTDPDGERLLQRLRIEVRNAAEGTTLYPVTMAEILAGMKSTDRAIRDWSRRKLVRTGFMAAAFLPIKLGLDLATLPVRITMKVVIKGAITGAKVAWINRRGQQGIRSGEGDVSDEKWEYARESVKTAAIKLVLSLPPGLAEMLGVASIALDVYEGGLKGAAKQIAKDIIGEAPWSALDVGSRMAAEAYTDALLNAAQEKPESTSEVASEKEEGDEDIIGLSAKDELKRMANESSDRKIRTMAQRLLAQLGDDDVQIEQSNRKVRAHYNLSTQSIKIGANSPDWERMHEIAHSLTAHKLWYARENPESEHGQWTAQIDALRQKAKDAYKGNDKNTLHYLESMDEFVAGLYSGESDFIDHLKSIRTVDSTILSNVIEFILRLLGLGVEQKSALTEAMGLSDKLIDSPLDGMDKDEHSGILYSPENNADLTGPAAPKKKKTIIDADIQRAEKKMERAAAKAEDYKRDYYSKITPQTPFHERQSLQSAYNDLELKSYRARERFLKLSGKKKTITDADIHRAEKKMERAAAKAEDYKRDYYSKITPQTPFYERQSLQSAYNDLELKSYRARERFLKLSGIHRAEEKMERAAAKAEDYKRDYYSKITPQTPFYERQSLQSAYNDLELKSHRARERFLKLSAIHRAEEKMERAAAKAEDYKRDYYSKITPQTPFYERKSLQSAYNDLELKSHRARERFLKLSGKRPVLSVSLLQDGTKTSRTRFEGLSKDRTIGPAFEFVEDGTSVSQYENPLPQETQWGPIQSQASTIFGTSEMQPDSSLSQQEREQRIDAYGNRVRTQLASVESGSEAERNVKFLTARPFLTPAGYFSGGLMAAGYDPNEPIVITYKTYTGLYSPKNLQGTSERTYAAWEIAAGLHVHDKPEKGGIVNFSSEKFKSPEDERKVKDLESIGEKLQARWEEDVAKPTRDSTGTLDRRSGEADAHTLRATLGSLLRDEDNFKQLSSEGQAAVTRTLDHNGQVIIPNVYGYPLAGYAFIPYTPYDGNYEHRPNQGLLIDLRNGAVSEIHGDDDFANWAEKNRDNLLHSFNASDSQGGKDVHWPKAGDVLDNLIRGNEVRYEGYYNLVSDQQIPVRETFNYTRSRGGEYGLKYGNLATDGDNGIASKYQAVNAKNAKWADQTQVFGSSQQNWKSAKGFWNSSFGYLPVIGSAGNIVIGVHDSIDGMTADDRIGGNAAAFISSLQLGHDIATGAVDLAAEARIPSAFKPPATHDYGWIYNSEAHEFKFKSSPKVMSETNHIGVGEEETFTLDIRGSGNGVDNEMLQPPPLPPVNKMVAPKPAIAHAPPVSEQLTFGPQSPKEPNGMLQDRAAEIRNIVDKERKISAFTKEEKLEKAEEIRAIEDKKKTFTSTEGRYHGNVTHFRARYQEWEDIKTKGQLKYDEFYTSQGKQVSPDTTTRYTSRYESYKPPESDRDSVEFMNDKGDVSKIPGKHINVKVWSAEKPAYEFRVSDNGEVLVVDEMWGKLDKDIKLVDKPDALPMNELQGEFIKDSPELQQNIKYITQETIANTETQRVMDLILPKSKWAGGAVVKLKPPSDAFNAMLTTPNVQPTARMLSTYSEFNRQIVEIRIQGYNRITMVLGPRAV
ncbi:hypothetical protein B0T39_15210 [Chromobacterium haemolyticum]|nr:hypothetical protein B0T39_15210 [Chromobacterium haemolyticum]